MTPMRPPCPRPRRRGFTLVEVLVALAIVAVAVTAGVQATDALTRLSQRQSVQWLAQLCADQALVAARLDPVFPSPGERLHTCAQAGYDFAVTIDVGTTPNPSFRRVQVRVALAEQPQDVLLRATTVLGRH